MIENKLSFQYIDAGFYQHGEQQITLLLVWIPHYVYLYSLKIYLHILCKITNTLLVAYM